MDNKKENKVFQLTFNKVINFLKAFENTIKKPKTELFGESKNESLYPYSKSMEKQKNKEQDFILPFVQKRYDEINTALKYTKHSKKRVKLLKAKKHYDNMLKNR